MRSTRSTATRPVAALVAAAVAALAVAAAPGTAHAVEDGGLDCVATHHRFSATYECEAESEDLSWYVSGLCAAPFGGFPARSATVGGSGTATATCPLVGPFTTGLVDVTVVVV